MLLAPAKKGGMLCAERAAKPNLNAYFLSPATRFVAKPCALKTPQPEYSFGDLPSKKESHLSRGDSARMFLSFSASVGDPKISKHCKKPSAESSPRSRPSVSESEITPAPIRLNARATSWRGINDGSLGVRGTTLWKFCGRRFVDFDGIVARAYIIPLVPQITCGNFQDLEDSKVFQMLP